MTREARDALDVERLARELLAEGVDFLKVKCFRASFAEGKTRRVFTAEEMLPAFNVAHAAGKRAACHTYYPDEVRLALEVGADSIEHALYAHADLSVMRELAERGAALVPCWASWSASPHAESDRPANHRRVVEAAIEAGAKVATGTDLYAQSLVDEIEALSEFGLGPHGALQAATQVAADVLGLASEIGTIEKGKRADLIVTDGDPLTNADVLRAPLLVIQRGVVVHDRRAVAVA
jgi:imidazolonepropionase-like amidohydrolase